MPKIKELKGLHYRGSGYMLYEDKANPRKTDNEVTKMLEKHFGKDIVHIARIPHTGNTSHLVQYAHLYEKDMRRSTKKLADKFNNC